MESPLPRRLFFTIALTRLRYRKKRFSRSHSFDLRFGNGACALSEIASCLCGPQRNNDRGSITVDSDSSFDNNGVKQSLIPGAAAHCLHSRAFTSAGIVQKQEERIKQKTRPCHSFFFFNSKKGHSPGSMNATVSPTTTVVLATVAGPQRETIHDGRQ